MTRKETGALLLRVGQAFLSGPPDESADACRARLLNILGNLTPAEAAVVFPVMVEMGMAAGLIVERDGVLEVA